MKMYILHVFPLGDYVTQLLVSWTAGRKVWGLDLKCEFDVFLGKHFIFPLGLGTDFALTYFLAIIHCM